MRRFLMILAGTLLAIPNCPTRAADVPDLGTRKQGLDWPRFLGPTGDSKSPERGILTHWPEQGPRLVWHLRLGQGYCMPAISRGRLFVFDRLVHEARLRCVESETGKELWQYTYPTDYRDTYDYDGGPRASPIVDDDRVYTFGPDGTLTCLNILDHKVLWSVDTTKKFHVVQNFFGVGSTPVIEGNLLIVQIGGSPAGADPDAPGQLDLAKGNGSGVVAFDKLTGEVKYQLSDELAAYASPTLATINGRRWCFVFARGGLIGFDPLTGKQDFHYPWRAKLLESVNASTPVVTGDTVFISECYQVGSSLLRVHPGGFDVVWRDPPGIREEKAMKLHWNTPICVDGYLYGSSGRQPDSADLRCIELATGKVKWSEPELTRTSLLYADGHFVCLTEAGQLLLIKANPEKFDPVAKVIPTAKEDPVGGLDLPDHKLLIYPCWAAPILSHGLLYIRGRDQLACLELIPEKPR
jgi:outer membrane protein assembly factor BamB